MFLRSRIHASVCCVHVRLYPGHGQICIFKRAEALLIDPQRSNMYYREMSFAEYSSACWSINFYRAGRLQHVLLHFAQSMREKHPHLHHFLSYNGAVFSSLFLRFESTLCSLLNDPSAHKCSLWWQSLGRWCVCGRRGRAIFFQDGIYFKPRRTTDQDTPPPAGQTCFPEAETRRRSEMWFTLCLHFTT